VASAEPPEEFVGTVSERIKASVTVLEFVSQYVDLKLTASGAVGLCPFHDDHCPSLGVNTEGDYWHCFAGCGGGSVCDFTTAVRELGETLS
jgi:DNA primase